MCKKLSKFLKLFGKCSGKDIQLHIFKNLYGTKNNSIIKFFFILMFYLMALSNK